MSPVGGQGMNTGFADAEFLAWALDQMLLGNEAPEPLLKAYSRYRRRSAASAIRRAHWSMWLGTWRGRARSAARDFIIRNLFCRGPLARRMGSLYAMLNIPYNSLERVPVSRLIPAEA
jgi:2-polyprenyl-6-methoxyphenol hydroxylase-like FAD-dependent oxidoreductase